MRPVYFYVVPPGPPERAEYQSLAVSLAEGLQALGVPVVGDADYWQPDPARPPLIRHDPDVRPEDCTAVVVSHVWPESGRPLPDVVGRRGGAVPTVYLDQADGAVTRAWTEPFHAFDLVLRTHANARQAGVPGNVRPWAFGLSERILAATALAGPADARDRAMLVNFRVRHLLRRRAWTVLHRHIAPVLPLDTRAEAHGEPGAADARLWALTGRRHHPAYYARLKRTLAGATFGGFFGPERLPDPHSPLYNPARIAAHLAEPVRRPFGRPAGVLYQWDSWRFWETLAAGTAAFHVDLARHGAALPVAPTADVHYVALDLERPRTTAERIGDDPGWLGDVGAAGARWAREHYSPEATARRFLGLVGAPTR